MLYSCMPEDSSHTSQFVSYEYEARQKSVAKLDIDTWNRYVSSPDISEEDLNSTIDMDPVSDEWRASFNYNLNEHNGWQSTSHMDDWSFSNMDGSAQHNLVQGMGFEDVQAKYLSSPPFSVVSYNTNSTLNQPAQPLLAPHDHSVGPWTGFTSENADERGGSDDMEGGHSALTEFTDEAAALSAHTDSRQQAEQMENAPVASSQESRKQSRSARRPKSKAGLTTIDEASLDSAQTEEDGVAEGRTDPLYSRDTRDEAGFYHCPFENDADNCGHTPTKLKCNYDKYVDSHLRPWSCNQAGCEKLRFSSVACRLRHEREMHGAHGHGMKPYLCKYAGCERSQPGRGFPRSWNCLDHMRRVHGYDHPDPSSGGELESPLMEAQAIPIAPPIISVSQASPPTPPVEAITVPLTSDPAAASTSANTVASGTGKTLKRGAKSMEKKTEKKRKTSVGSETQHSTNASTKRVITPAQREEIKMTQENFKKAHVRLHELVHQELRPGDDGLLNAILQQAQELNAAAAELKRMSARLSQKPVSMESCPNTGQR